MIERKFDLVTVKNYKEDIDNLFYMVNELLYGIGPEKINKGDVAILISSFEDVIRLSSMYNTVIEQVIQYNNISISTPQKYISANLRNACNLTEMVYNKYKYLSRFGNKIQS